MQKLKQIILLLTLFSTGLTGLYAQQTLPATGGDATGSGGSSSYTVGQVAYTTNTALARSVSQGVQQPFEISILTGLADAQYIDLNFSVSPNPATDKLQLKIEADHPGEYMLSLYDMHGALIEKLQAEGILTTIDMSRLEISAYFLKVTINNKAVKTFKIIKN